jgi:hypothetical protein
MSRPDQLPIEAVRDLLGITRAMYAAAKRDGDTARMLELSNIGKQLTTALELGKTQPDTIGHRAAWEHAEEATGKLVRMISVSTPAAPIVQAAAMRVRQRGPLVSSRDEIRAVARKRS